MVFVKSHNHPGMNIVVRPLMNQKIVSRLAVSLIEIHYHNQNQNYNHNYYYHHIQNYLNHHYYLAEVYSQGYYYNWIHSHIQNYSLIQTLDLMMIMNLILLRGQRI